MEIKLTGSEKLLKEVMSIILKEKFREYIVDGRMGYMQRWRGDEYKYMGVKR